MTATAPKRLAEIFALPLRVDEKAVLAVDANDRMPPINLETIEALARAINCHDDLLAALRDLEMAAQAMLDCTDDSERGYLIEEAEKARAAIAKAVG